MAGFGVVSGADSIEDVSDKKGMDTSSNSSNLSLKQAFTSIVIGGVSMAVAFINPLMENLETALSLPENLGGSLFAVAALAATAIYGGISNQSLRQAGTNFLGFAGGAAVASAIAVPVFHL